MAIETFTYTGNFFDAEGTIEPLEGGAPNPYQYVGGAFNSDGTKFFAFSSNPDGFAFEFDLSTPYRPDTGTYNGNFLETTSLTSAPFGGEGILGVNSCFFNPAGTVLNVSGSSGVNQYAIKYTLSTPFDLSSATFDAGSVTSITSLMGVANPSFPVSDVKNDGTEVYFLKTSTAADVISIPLSTPYDLTTASSGTTNTVPGAEGHTIGARTGIAFSSDGALAFVSFLPDTFDRTVIAEYACSPAFDVSTLSYTGNFIEDTDATGETMGSFSSNPAPFFRKDDFSSLFWVGFDQFEAATFNETIFEYSGILEPPCRLQAQFTLKSGGVARKVVNTVDGLHHLSIGDTCNNIVALVDGSVVDVQSCTGRVTLPRGAARAHFGLPYTTDIETPNIATGDGDEGQGKRKKVTDVTLRMYKSRSPIVGPNFFDMIPMKQRNEEPIGAPTTLLTGDLRVNIPPAWSSNGKISIRQKDPVPLTILAIIPEFDIEDDD